MQPLTWESREKIREAFRLYPPELSEFTFTNLFMWLKSRPLWFFEVEGTLAFFRKDKEGNWILFGPLFGKMSFEEFLSRLPVAVSGFDRIPFPYVKRCCSAPDQCDYVYRIQHLTHLEGPRFQRKRQLIHGCIDRYGPIYEVIDQGNIGELFLLHEEIFADAPKTEGLEEEFIAVKELLNIYFDVRVRGGLIRIDGKAKAFIICGHLNPTTAVGHAEKAARNFYGLSELALHWICTHALQEYTYLNTEQDLGLAGLREAKTRWHPDHMTVKYRFGNN